jgi:mRNA-decapping enzyme subunit 2
VSAEPVSTPRAIPMKTRAGVKPRLFQPQILRRSEKVDLDMILPSRTVTAHEFPPNQPDVVDSPVPVPSEKSPVLPNYDRRPNQPVAQKETLLALFGKTPAQPPVTQATESSSAFRPPVTSTAFSEKASHHRGGVAPLPVPGHTSPVKSGLEVPVTSKVASSDNRAFLLGFLEEVAKGNK